MKKFFEILLILTVINYALYSAPVGDGGVTLPILNYVAGTRAMGLGTAYTALSDEITSLYWNPAGLARLNKQQVYAMYEKLYEDTTYWFGGYALPFYGIGVFGVGLIYLTTGDINGAGPMQEDLGVYNDSQAMLIISYGSPLNQIKNFKSRHLKFLDLGASLKIVKHTLYTYTSYGFALDLGAKYVPISTSKIFKNFIFGLVVQNILPPASKLEKEREWYPLKIKFGTCYRTLYDTLLINVDVSQILIKKKSPEFNFGVEYFIMRMFRVRTGYKEGISGGLGLEIEDFAFDYALNYNFDLGLVHQFSASMKFGGLH